MLGNLLHRRVELRARDLGGLGKYYGSVWGFDVEESRGVRSVRAGVPNSSSRRQPTTRIHSITSPPTSLNTGSLTQNNFLPLGDLPRVQPGFCEQGLDLLA